MLYPEIEPYDTGRLPVSEIHEIYYEQVGNPRGRPALFLHGGPGAGSTGMDRRFFNPDAYRLVLFDQRGAGRSTPHACLDDNTTWHLIDDMECLRQHLGVDRWMLFGGSWGSTLALAYAQRHPDRVTAMVLRGIFLMQQAEFDWYYRAGTPAVFPEAAAEFHALIPNAAETDVVAAYHSLITCGDPRRRRRALQAWARWEAETSSLLIDAQRIAQFTEPGFAESMAGIELHYFKNRGFFDHDSQLLDNAGRIRDIPGIIVHGRYDMVCPVRNAYALDQVWAGANLQIVPDAGHNAHEAGIVDALIRATDALGR